MARWIESPAARKAREESRYRAAAQALNGHKQFERNPGAWLDSALRSKARAEEFPSEAMRRLVRYGRELGSWGEINAYVGLVERAGACRALGAALQRVDGLDAARGCASLARDYRFWRRPLDEWRDRSRRAAEQFAGLARHLLADYETPRVLDSLLLERQPGCCSTWFRFVAQGGSLRSAPGLTTSLTRRQAHETLAAPERLTFIEALRWGQVAGMGGSQELSGALLNTRLGREVGDAPAERFWEMVLLWLVGHPEVPAEQVGLLCDYLEARRFGDPVLGRPAEPEFSMKGRSPAALMELVRRWHRELNRLRALTGSSPGREIPARFPACGIQGAEIARKRNREVWSITEILTLQALAEEGKEMSHCVLSYALRVADGQCSIWTMRVRSCLEPRPRRALTIEMVNRSRTIVQARGKLNRLPAPAERAVLEAWAREQRLELRC